MPYGGTGNVYKGILNAGASHEDAGKIVSYSWSESGPDFLYPGGQQPNLSKDSTAITFFNPGYHQFNLEIRDDHDRIDRDQIIFNVIAQFSYEYDALSWDSTIGALTTISVKFKPGLIETWPDSISAGPIREVYLINYTGAFYDISTWKKLPYVSYDAIQLTNQSLFYTLVPGHSFQDEQATSYPEIYGRTNSGIDFSQKVSVGFIIVSPWDY
jgi:hypothetical protein